MQLSKGLKKLKEFYGSQYAIHKALGVSNNAVSNWYLSKSEIGLDAAAKAQKETNGYVMAADFREYEDT